MNHNATKTITDNRNTEKKITADDVVEITGDLLENVSGGASRTNRDSPPDNLRERNGIGAD